MSTHRSIYDKENESRSEGLRKNPRNEELLSLMNDTLRPAHQELLAKYRQAPKHPLILPFGLPRSGTTLLVQVLTQYFDVGYADNTIARFWKAPLFGVALSRELVKERHFPFSSLYGKTKEPAAPHEFSYFWHHWLNLKSLEGFDIETVSETADWQGLTGVLGSMIDMFDKPLVLKGIFPAYFMKKITEILPQSFFIYIKRDPEDIAVSLYHARMAYYGTPRTWWSMYPPQYRELLEKDWHEQIAGQVYYLAHLYEEQLKTIPEENYAVIDYQSLCAQPKNILSKLQEKIDADQAGRLEIASDIPDNFTVSCPDRNFEGCDLLLNSVKKYFGR